MHAYRKLTDHRRQFSALFHPALISAALNYYLAANAACRYPFADARQELVCTNLRSSLRCLGLAKQRDPSIVPQVAMIRELWAHSLLPQDEAELALSTH